MRLCVPIPCFFWGMDLPAGIRKVRELGFDAAETYEWRGQDLEAVKNACEETGVELLSMCTTEFRMTDPTFRKEWLAGLRESCQAAKKAGVKRLITLEDSGVTVMIEPLNTLVNHPGYYLWSSAEAFDLIREVSHPLVKVVYDIYHQQVMEGNIISSITNNLDCIAHLHSAGHPGRHELQFGENDYKVIFAAVDKAGYKGACGLEYSPLLDPEESLREAKRIYGA